MKKNFLIIDDHSIVRQGLTLLIKKNINFSEIYSTSTLAGALNFLKSENIEYIILDINLPDGEGVYSIQKIKNRNHSAKILVFSGSDENIYGVRYIQAGANGFLSKLASEEEMISALQKFTETGEYYSSNIKEKIFENFISKKNANPIELLTEREMEVAMLLIKGYGNLEISSHLNLQKSTVSTYKNRLYEKLSIQNLPDLIELFRLYHE